VVLANVPVQLVLRVEVSAALAAVEAMIVRHGRFLPVAAELSAGVASAGRRKIVARRVPVNGLPV
jgi:hypothetical protein